MAKLCQIVAEEKRVKSWCLSELTALHRDSQNKDKYNGFSRTYTPKDDEGERFPSEHKKIQNRAFDVIESAQEILTKLFDITATKDWTNCAAFADIVIDDNVILEKVPATYLLFLEKQIVDIRTFIEKIPEIDETEDWIFDEISGVYKTPAIETNKTKKIPKVIVAYEATKEHPAQTTIINEDVTIGSWDTVKHTGALSSIHKKRFLNRIEKLAIAVKYAREEANSVYAEQKYAGEKIFKYLFE